MMMYRKIAALTVCAAMGLAATPALADKLCPVLSIPPVAVPVAKKRMASNREVLVVALGSSSTEGVRASSPSHTYPALLQEDLNRAFPQAHFAVINRGIGGQDATEELARLDTDAIALHPDVVIWQVGANGAMANSNPDVFRQLVSTGIERLKALGIDVVLMDNQRSPMILSSPAHLVLERILAELAVKYNVSLFSRGALMDGWKREGQDYAVYLASDNVHMNDLGYHCVADALATAIQAGMDRPETPVAIAHATIVPTK